MDFTTGSPMKKIKHSETSPTQLLNIDCMGAILEFASVKDRKFFEGVSTRWKGVYEYKKEALCLNDLTRIVRDRKMAWKIPKVNGDTLRLDECLPPIMVTKRIQTIEYMYRHYRKVVHYPRDYGYTTGRAGNDPFIRRIMATYDLWSWVDRKKDVYTVLKSHYKGDKWDELFEVVKKGESTAVDFCYQLEKNGGLFGGRLWR